MTMLNHPKCYYNCFEKIFKKCTTINLLAYPEMKLSRELPGIVQLLLFPTVLKGLMNISDVHPDIFFNMLAGLLGLQKGV